MPRRYEAQSGAIPSFPLRLGTALRNALRHGYTARDLRSDLLAGLVVGIVALPLSMALAIASGVAPQHGLYTAIVAGGVIALSAARGARSPGRRRRSWCSWPRSRRGSASAGCSWPALMAGLILLVHGRARLGAADPVRPLPGHHRLHRRHRGGHRDPAAQGLPRARRWRSMPEHYLERVAALAAARCRRRAGRTSRSAPFTLACSSLWPRVTRKVPGAAGRARPRRRSLAALLQRFVPGFHVGHHPQPLSYGRRRAAAASRRCRRCRAALAPARAGRQRRSASRFDLLRELAALRLRHRHAGRHRVAALGRGRRRHDRHASTTPTPSWWRRASATSWRRSSAASPPPAPSRARPPTSAPARARRSRRSSTRCSCSLRGAARWRPLLGYLPMASLAALLLSSPGT